MNNAPSLKIMTMVQILIIFSNAVNFSSFSSRNFCSLCFVLPKVRASPAEYAPRNKKTPLMVRHIKIKCIGYFHGAQR